MTDEHAWRAIGYVGAALAEAGDLPADFEQPRLLELWAEAVAATPPPIDGSTP